MIDTNINRKPNLSVYNNSSNHLNKNINKIGNHGHEPQHLIFVQLV